MAVEVDALEDVVALDVDDDLVELVDLVEVDDSFVLEELVVVFVVGELDVVVEDSGGVDEDFVDVITEDYKSATFRWMETGVEVERGPISITGEELTSCRH